jgi:hypothetical protein
MSHRKSGRIPKLLMGKRISNLCRSVITSEPIHTSSTKYNLDIPQMCDERKVVILDIMYVIEYIMKNDQKLVDDVLVLYQLLMNIHSSVSDIKNAQNKLYDYLQTINIDVCSRNKLWENYMEHISKLYPLINVESA